MTRMQAGTAPLARDPLAGDPAEAAIRGMVETIVREARPRPLTVILFGSRARGTHRPTSDADFLVVLPEGMDTRRVAIDIDNNLPCTRIPAAGRLGHAANL